MTAAKGYFRQPTLHGNTIVFVCETDLWSVPTTGGVARRLTAHQVDASWPQVSPDGQMIAYSAMEEGVSDVYVMPADGGTARRLTFHGGASYVCGFSRDGRDVLYATMATAPFARLFQIYAVPLTGGSPKLLPWGPARRVAFGPNGAVVITRREQEIARWKRYKGGTKGDLWIDARGNGVFQEILAALEGNLGSPCFAGDRLYFVADHEGYGNVYSCKADGSDLKRCTDHHDFYARALSSDGKRLVYQCGADIYLYDPQSDRSTIVDVRVNSSKPQMTRKFAPAGRFLQGFSLHPDGHSLCVTTRGKPFVMGNWEREVIQLGKRDGVRYRLSQWLPDGKHIVTVSDEGGEEALEVHALPGDDGVAPPPVRLTGLDIGHIRALFVSPVKNQVVAGNHRFELIHVDLDAKAVKVLDRSHFEDVQAARFSPDGRYVAFISSRRLPIEQVFIADLEAGTVHPVTREVGHDRSVAWDPDGRYLYFVSTRTWDPVYDTQIFDLGFPKGGKVYAIALRKDVESPFHPMPKPLEGAAPSKKDEAKKDDIKKDDGKKDDPKKDDVKPIVIDFDGIADRVIEFPIPEARYSRILASKTKIFIGETPVEGSLNRSSHQEPQQARLHVYDLEALKFEPFVEGVNAFTLSKDGKTLAYRQRERIRVVKTAAKPDAKETKVSRQTGWVDLDRIRLSVVPRAEWGQMLREMWRLQRDHFWTADMSQLDWAEVYERYLPILNRVATRSEFSDLAWEVQGELGTSHAYEMGGDLKFGPVYPIGRLGADLVWDGKSWIVAKIVRGDAWDRSADSPLAAPGVNIAVGDQILAVDGILVDGVTSPNELLVHKAGVDVAVAIKSAHDGSTRRVIVRPLTSETSLRYREWVENNRAAVHAATGGRIGYVHVPDMGARGFAEFHRYYPQESYRDGIIVDVRYNGGGHVSQLLLEKLARKRLSYTVSHHLQPIGEPMYAVDGPIVAITNEFAGSDGDIFSHGFKMLKLGILIGKRTWGGVIGIDSRNSLVDGTVVTQPEYATWFKDVGWGVENYGTDPDIEVDIAPQDWVAGRDPQLEKAIAFALAALDSNPPLKPQFGDRPNLKRPVFMKRG